MQSQRLRRVLLPLLFVLTIRILMASSSDVGDLTIAPVRWRLMKKFRAKFLGM